MNRERRYVRLVIDRKSALILLAVVVLIGGAGFLSSQQLSMTATYPIPAGVYNQIVTTGNAGATAANTTLNRNAGNTILVPPTNAGGNVGVGTTNPGSKLEVAGSLAAASAVFSAGARLGDDASACTAANAGTLRWRSGALEVCNGSAWSGTSASPPGTLGGHCKVTCSFMCPNLTPFTITPQYPATTCAIPSGCAWWTRPEMITDCAPGWSRTSSSLYGLYYTAAHITGLCPDGMGGTVMWGGPACIKD